MPESEPHPPSAKFSGNPNNRIIGREPHHIALINPNTSQATTAMMTQIAQRHLPAFHVDGMTAVTGVPMIVDEQALAAAVPGVVEMGLAAQSAGASGIIVAAFGDPGLEDLSARCKIPVVGICEASMREAAHGQRRFGIATVTPNLVASFAAKAEALGLSSMFTGTRLTIGDPVDMTRDPRRLTDTLETAVRACFDLDGTEAVIIGGGPLGEAAKDLQLRFTRPVIAPLASAARSLSTRFSR